MNRRSLNRSTLAALIAGVVLGAAGLMVGQLWQDGVIRIGPQRRHDDADFDWGPPPEQSSAAAVVPPPAWFPPEYRSQCDWARLVVNDAGWSTGEVGTFEDLDDIWKRTNESSTTEIAIPVFPSVFRPDMCDKIYYDALLASDIQPGDKVLVIGTGSGADAWVASLKSHDVVYVVERNPVAVLNARVTARLGGFRIKPVVGDVLQVDLPDDFADFDYVLWNMPFVQQKSTADKFEARNFHDGDNGRLLQRLLALLPSLLKEDGKAMLLNTAVAEELITFPGVTKTYDPTDRQITGGTITLFEFRNPGTAAATP